MENKSILILMFIGALFWFGFMYYIFNAVLVDNILTAFPDAQTGPYWGLMFAMWHGLPWVVFGVEAVYVIRKAQRRSAF